MKLLFRRKLLVLTFILGLALVLTPKSYAEEKITDFHTDMVLNQTGEFVVTETIKYDSGTLDKHGIYRDIRNIFTNDQGDDFKTPIKVISVTDESGKAYNYEKYQSGDNYQIKIGDANKTFVGAKTYVIKYTFTGGVEGFSDHDEIYHNLVGEEWLVPIENYSATIALPSSIPTSNILTACYSGGYDTAEQDCTLQQQGNTITLQRSTKIYSGQDVTIAISFDKGYVTITPKVAVGTPKWLESLLSFLYFAWFVFPPLVIIIIFFLFGRDPKTGITSIPVLFEPPKDDKRRLTPAEVGTIEDEEVDSKDISATIVDLAIRGHLKINETDEKIVLEKSNLHLSKDTNKLQPFEQKILDILFKNRDSIGVKNLSESDKADLAKVKDDIYKAVVTNGFFPHNPDTIRTVWVLIGVAGMFTFAVVTGIVAFIMAHAMPRKTLKGARIKIDILGLRKFMTSQTEQLKFQELNWFLFEKLLPYAVAFGITKTWAKRFESLHDLPTYDWYTNKSFTNLMVLNAMTSSLSTSVSRAITPTSTRSGGGFSSGFSGGHSGGGFSGGGGGGSW